SRCRLSDLHPAAHDARASRGRALVRRERSIALDHLDAVEAAAELLGNHLPDRDTQPLPEIDLATVDRDATVGADREKAVDLVGMECLADRLFHRRDLLAGSGAGQ